MDSLEPTIADLKAIRHAALDADATFMATTAVASLRYFHELCQQLGKPIGELTSSDIINDFKEQAAKSSGSAA